MVVDLLKPYALNTNACYAAELSRAHAHMHWSPCLRRHKRPVPLRFRLAHVTGSARGTRLQHAAASADFAPSSCNESSYPHSAFTAQSMADLAYRVTILINVRAGSSCVTGNLFQHRCFRLACRMITISFYELDQPMRLSAQSN